MGELLAQPPRHVDAGLDADGDAAEGDAAGDPGERLAGEAASDERIQQRGVASGRRDQLCGLLLGGEEAGAGEQAGEVVLPRRPVLSVQPQTPAARMVATRVGLLIMDGLRCGCDKELARVTCSSMQSVSRRR
ncbi:MAG TPA: hypothetical protein VN193_02025 [Candidatus Angelobacter sp.]|nr:hypothetical protein [Candidatus Angelobacter sp.]